MPKTRELIYTPYGGCRELFLARDPEGEVRVDTGRESAWKTLAELHELPMPPANAQILRALHWRLSP